MHHDTTLCQRQEPHSKSCSQQPDSPAPFCGNPSDSAEASVKDSHAHLVVMTAPEHQRSKRRVNFAAGPLEWDGGLSVAADGHPNHEGQVARQRRCLGQDNYGEPITKHTIKFLEAQLGSEYAASITRLKRRFGLAPMVQRDLPYITEEKDRKPEAEKLEHQDSWPAPVIMERIPKPEKAKQSPAAKQKPVPEPQSDSKSKTRRKYRTLNDFGFESKPLPSPSKAAVK